MLPCLQVASYVCTLVCLRVETLEQCVAMAAPAFREGMVPFADAQAKAMTCCILAALRQWLYVQALGGDAPLPDSCPALHAEACFDACCPLAARMGLQRVRKPLLPGHSGPANYVGALMCRAVSSVYKNI